MKKVLSQVKFSGTEAQEKQLDAVIEKYANMDGSLMPILQEAQGIYGYLPLEVLKHIAAKTGMPLEEIYGVATFYSQFNLSPKGEYKISICLGTACYVKGAGEILDEVSKELGIENGGCTDDMKFSLDACRCVGACGLAPVLMVNEEVYGRITAADVKSILDKYI